MNIALILWIVAFFIVWEGIYIFLVRRDKEDENYDWGIHKFYSCGLTILIFMIQIFVVGNYGSADYGYSMNMFPFHYERLIWEFGILLGLFVFFKINKKIYNFINKEKK